MGFVQDEENELKIKIIFKEFANEKGNITNHKIKDFFYQLGVTSQLFYRDLYFHLPEIEKGADLSYHDCLAFIDFIFTPKTSKREMINVFKLFDKNGNGHVTTNDILSILKRELKPSDYESYFQMISAYGPTINYMDILKNKKI